MTRGPFGWWGRAVYRWRWPVVAAWVIVLLAAVPLLPGLPGRLSASGFSDPDLPSARAEATLRRELGLPANTMAVFYVSANRPYADPEVRAAVNASLGRLRELPDVAGIIPPDLNSRQIGRSGRTAYAVVNLADRPQGAVDLLPELQRRVAVPDLPAGRRLRPPLPAGRRSSATCKQRRSATCAGLSW